MPKSRSQRRTESRARNAEAKARVYNPPLYRIPSEDEKKKCIDDAVAELKYMWAWQLLVTFAASNVKWVWYKSYETDTFAKSSRRWRSRSWSTNKRGSGGVRPHER